MISLCWAQDASKPTIASLRLIAGLRKRPQGVSDGQAREQEARFQVHRIFRNNTSDFKASGKAGPDFVFFNY